MLKPLISATIVFCCGTFAGAAGYFLASNWQAGVPAAENKIINSSDPAGQLNIPTQTVRVGSEQYQQKLQALEHRLSDLSQMLAAEQQSSLAQQRELRELRDKFDVFVSSPSAADPVVDLTPDQPVTDFLPTATENSATGQRNQQSALLAAGIDPDTVRDLSFRLDQYTLAELDIRDRAAREGWLRSADYRQRRDELLPARVDLRSELGDEAYDRYLLASGRENRVQIASLIRGSAADIAGFQVGDTVLEYAGERVFTVRELQQATRDGERGETITARLGRGDSVLDTTVERGPLGVTLSSRQEQIDAAAAVQ